MVARKYDLQIRGVPADVRTRLRRRVSRKGVSMSQYVIDLLRDDLERPTMAEWLEEVRSHPPVDLPAGVTGGTIIREMRDREEAGLDDD